jgi:hypothetical protein
MVLGSHLQIDVLEDDTWRSFGSFYIATFHDFFLAVGAAGLPPQRAKQPERKPHRQRDQA